MILGCYIDQNTLATVNTILAIVTLVVVLVQLKLMLDQTDIMRRQDQLLSRKSEIEIAGQFDGERTIHFMAKNTGNKGAPQYYWHIYVPRSVPSADNFFIEGYAATQPKGEMGINGFMCRMYKGKVKDALYPSRMMLIGNIILDPPPTGESEYKIFWKSITEDGAVPPATKEFSYFTIPVCPGRESPNPFPLDQ